MRTRRLGSTGIEVSVVGVGTWQFGGAWGKAFDDAEVAAILTRGQELGINLIDTAECYGSDHRSETLIGANLPGSRADWVIATKFGHVPGGEGPPERYWQPEEVRRQLEGSLAALRTDHVDLYQFHSGGDEVFDNDELWEMLRGFKQSGKVRHLGISVRGKDYLHQIRRAREVGAEAIQIIYNRLTRGPEEEAFPLCREQDLGVLARVPLASGFLSGKYRPGARFEQGDVRHNRDAGQIDQALAEVERIRAEEVPDGIDMASWALAWCLRHEAVTCVIPGCKSPEQVASNAAAVEQLEGAS